MSFAEKKRRETQVGRGPATAPAGSFSLVEEEDDDLFDDDEDPNSESKALKSAKRD